MRAPETCDGEGAVFSLKPGGQKAGHSWLSVVLHCFQGLL